MVYLILFLNIFLVYIYTSFPTIAAYRDAGEFATVGYLLGVAHPPGYPLYTLLIYIFGRILPFGNFAYRINLFSTIMSALTSVVLFYTFVFVNRIVCKTNRNQNFLLIITGYLLSLIFSFSYLQWYLSLVSEMYTLNTLFAILLLLFCLLYFEYDKHFVYLLVFIFGIGLSNRLDLVLFIPLVIIVSLDFVKASHRKIFTTIVLSMLFFFGFICYLYLPLRSSCKPFIDWNNPAQPSRFISSLLRRTHGSTLDLISVGYKSGENFFDGFNLYISYLIKNITVIGILLVLLGIKKIFAVNKKYLFGLTISWMLSCIYFIYKANMPPNPHAMAILEAHFLLPNIVVYVWLVFGISELIDKYKNDIVKFVIICFMIYLVCYNFFNNIPRLNKRKNFYAYDYTINLFRSLCNKSIVIIKEDVQLFSCWYQKFVIKARPQIYVVASGLSGSSWYQQMYRNFLRNTNLPDDIFITQVSSEEGLTEFVKKNLDSGYKVFIAPDVELVSTKKLVVVSINFVREVSFEHKEVDLQNIKFFYNDVYIFRNKYVYDLDWEFFSSDLVEDYSKSLLNCGHQFIVKNFIPEGIEEIYKIAISMNSLLPFPYLDLAYIFFLRGDYEQSLKWYNFGIEKCYDYLYLAKKYKTPQDTIDYIKSQLALFYLHTGVVCEKLGQINDAIVNYNKAIQYNPYVIDGYYNLAAVYWKLQDWNKVRYYLSQVLKINPQHKEARYFIQRIPQ